MKKFIGIIPFAGTTIAFFIGSGFATAQEILQYFAAYGRQFLLVIAVSMTIFVYTNWSFIQAGTKKATERPGGVFHYYCGKYIGTFYDIFSVIFIFLSYVVMCGGAGAAAAQQFALPAWTGVFILAVLVTVTVVLGLDNLVQILGKLGPVIILFIILIGVWTVVRDGENIMEGIRMVQNQEIELVRVGNNFFSSAVSYAGFVMLWFCTFMAELSAKNDSKTVSNGMFLGAAAIALTLVVVSLALLADIGQVADSEIPSIILAEMISPVFATVFSLITLCGIYTTGVPLLWTVASRCFPEGSGKFRTVTIALGLGGAAIALFLPYRNLVNIIYGINGYVGIALIFFMLWKDGRKLYLIRKK